jgi:hypothetical protein
MNKLREQIAISLKARDEEWPFEEAAGWWTIWQRGLTEPHFGDCIKEPNSCLRCYLEKLLKDADAIIALLQPRLLTKDEAEHLLELIPYSPACDDCLKATAKLKLIQEAE